MKKLAVIITIASVLSLCACGKGNKDDKEGLIDKIDQAERLFYTGNYSAVMNYRHEYNEGSDVDQVSVRLKTDGTRNFCFAVAEDESALASKEDQLGYFATVNYSDYLLNYYQKEGEWLLGTDYYSGDNNVFFFFGAFDASHSALLMLESYVEFVTLKGCEYTLDSYEDDQTSYSHEIRVVFGDDFVESIYYKHTFLPTGDVWTVDATFTNVGQNKIEAPEVDAFDLQVRYAIASYSASYQTMSIDYSFKLIPVEKPEDALIMACVLEVNRDASIYHLTYDEGEEYFKLVINGEDTDFYYYYMDEGSWTYKIDNSMFEKELGLIFNTFDSLYGFDNKEFIDAIKDNYQKKDDNSYTYKLSNTENSSELDITIEYDETYNTLTSIEAQGQTTISMFEESLECNAEYSINFAYGEFENITLPEILL